MKNHYLAKASLVCSLCVAMLLTGCISIGCCSMNAKYERTMQLSAPLSPESALAAETHNGTITINGADVAECSLTATIITRAATDEDAVELSDKVNVTLVPSVSGLTVKIDKPTNLINKSVCVNLDVVVPNKTDLKLITHNGAVKITDINGRLDATSHNGKIITENVAGSTTLKTHNGSITCNETSGDSHLISHNGSVKVFYTGNAPSVCDISMTTHNGSIELATPPDYSAQVKASTNNGSINTDLPITVVGKVSKSKLTGTIGAGEGQLQLETYNGSIRIR